MARRKPTPLATDRAPQASLDDGSSATARQPGLQPGSGTAHLHSAPTLMLLHGPPRSPEPVPVDLSTVARSAVDAVRPKAKQKGVPLTFAVGTATPAACRDAGSLSTVLQNMLNNALQDPSGKAVDLSVSPKGDEIEVVVGRDCAESRSDLPHLWGGFRRGAGQERETGGASFAAARQLIGAQGGRVGVRVGTSGRAECWFSLPSVESKTS
ncbi:MAG: sensor histidine kinase [Chloroflexota bacterium]